MDLLHLQGYRLPEQCKRPALTLAPMALEGRSCVMLSLPQAHSLVLGTDLKCSKSICGPPDPRATAGGLVSYNNEGALVRCPGSTSISASRSGDPCLTSSRLSCAARRQASMESVSMIILQAAGTPTWHGAGVPGDASPATVSGDLES